MSDRINRIDELIKEVESTITLSSKGQKQPSHRARKILVPAFAALLTFSAFYIYNRQSKPVDNPKTQVVSEAPVAQQYNPPVTTQIPKITVKEPEIIAIRQNLEPFYFIDKGNTLTGIAKNLYGDITVWREIYEMNKPMIENPDLIFVNQPLRLPRETPYSSEAVKAEIVNARNAKYSNQIPDSFYRMTEEEAKSGYEGAFKSVALKVTGSEGNWQRILEYNIQLNRKFDKYTLDKGEFIFIPFRLVGNQNYVAKIPTKP